MSVQVRPIREDEFDRLIAVQQYAFGADRSPEGIAAQRRRFLPEWALAAFDGADLVAGLYVIPFAMRVEGQPVPLGGVSSVGALPEHRRRGYTGALLRGALAAMRERGQALSALYTPHDALYRRFGWAPASRRPEYRFACKEVQLYGTAPSAGRARRLDEPDVPRLEEVYRRWAAGRTGPLDRVPLAWTEGVLSRSEDPPDVAVWEDEGGAWNGYAVYRAWYPGGDYQGQRLRVRELVACTPEAYQGLVRYLLHHDLVTDAAWPAPPDDPFLNAVVDPVKVQVTLRRGFVLRLVDVPAALAARPYAVDASLVLEVRDATAPWNQGRWRLAVREGRATVEPAGGEPDLSLDAADLAPLYDGYRTATALALAGLVAARSPEALDLADRLFATRTPPFTFDLF